MNIWIISSGVKLVYKSFLDIPVKEDLVSGLLTALNEFVRSEFNEPIDSIVMGGFVWVYDHQEEENLLFVAADVKGNFKDIETIKSRLQYIKEIFLKQYRMNEEWRNWKGNIDIFKPFAESLDQIYYNWQAAESLDLFAEFFDFLRVMQEILNIIRKIIDNQIDVHKKEKIATNIEDLFKTFKLRMDVLKSPELQNITYSKEKGFQLMTINPTNCDIMIVKKQLKQLMVQINDIIKSVLGKDLSLNYFSEFNLYNYLLRNNRLLKRLNLGDFFFQLFLLV